MKRKYSGTVKDKAGNIIASATIAVYLGGTGTAASIYLDPDSDTAVTGTTSDAYGRYVFYVSAFDYDSDETFKIVVSKTNYTSTTIDHITVEDVVAQAYSISANTTVTTYVKIPKGVTYAVASGVTLTFSGSFEAGRYQVFSGAGTIAFGLGTVDEVYPEWWGAVGDDSTDDTTALQAAINSGSTNGVIVELANKTYRFTTLTFSSLNYVTIKGQSWITSSLRTTSTSGNIMDLTNSRWITFKDVEITAGDPITSGSTFYLNNADDFWAENVRVAGQYNSFYILDGASVVTLSHVNILDFADHPLNWGILTSGVCSSIYLKNVYQQCSLTCTGGFIGIVAGADTVVCEWIGSQAFGTGFIPYGVYIEGGQYIHITDGFFEDGGPQGDCTGVLVAGGKKVVLKSCHYVTNRHGLRVVSGSDIQVIGGRCYLNEQNGIQLDGGTDVSIMSVDIEDNSYSSSGTYYGISIAADVSDFKIIGNTIKLSDASSQVIWGIGIWDGASDNYIISLNKVDAAACVSGTIYDGGSGTNKVVEHNITG